jgi:hypothetical protein
MVPARNNDVRRHRPTCRINSLNNGCSFSIILLHYFWPRPSFKARNYHIRENFAHYKASFVEVVDVRLLDAVFGYNIRKKPKPIGNQLRIFVLGHLIIV